MFTFLRNQILLVLFCLSAATAQNNAGDVIHQSSITQNLKAPVKFAIDASDNIYVTDDMNKSVMKYDASGNFIESINVGVSPLSVAINSMGQLFVGDGVTGKIFKVESNGTASEFYSACSFPSSMTFSPDGKLYIADGELKRVLVLDISGNLIQTIGLGTVLFPSEVVYDKRNSRILVSEHGGVGPGIGMSSLPLCKIWVFNTDGSLQTSFSSAGNANGRFYRIQGMTIGKCGNLFVCDPYQGNVSVFNENNVFITRFGQFGTQPGEINVPMDILFDSQERVIVASMNNGALEVFNINDTLPTSNIANSDATICSGQTADITIDFTGTAPWTFTYTIDGLNPVSITTSDNPYILQTTQGGLYEVTALTDQLKTGTCFSGSALIKVNSVIPAANISTGNATVCGGSAVDIPIQFTGTSPWTFTYTKDGINPTTITTANNPYILSTTEAGLYEVTAINAGGCDGNTFTGNANISVHDLPTSAFSTGNTQVSICQGQSAALPVDFTGTAPWTFTYTVNNANPVQLVTYQSSYTINTSDAGIYNITNVSDAHCSNSAGQGNPEVVVKPTPGSVMTPVITSTCSGSVVEIPVQFTGNAPFTFTYTLNDTVYYEVSTNNSQFVLQVNEAGVYQIINLYGDGCNSSNNTGVSEITTLSLPTAAYSFGNTQVSICQGQSATLPIDFTGTAPWTFSYTVDNLNPVTITTSDNPYMLNATDGGFYEIQSVSDANCYNSSTIGTPEVVVTPLPSSTMVNQTVASCNGLLADIPINFNGIAPWTFVYTVDGLNPVTITTSDNPYYLSVNTPGQYQVTGISSGNCIGTGIFGATDLVSANSPVPSFTYTSNGLEFTFTNTSLYSGSYLWNFGDGLTSTDINPIHLYVAPAVYDVVLTASNGLCPDTSIIQTIDLTTLVVDNAINNEILVFPNPSNGQVNIKLSVNSLNPWKVEIMNSIGQLVFAKEYNNQKEYIDLRSFSTGIYTIKISTDGVSKTEKLIISR